MGMGILGKVNTITFILHTYSGIVYAVREYEMKWPEKQKQESHYNTKDKSAPPPLPPSHTTTHTRENGMVTMPNDYYYNSDIEVSCE